jgi:ribosomal-protein-alanine N-acetyltransferase
MKFKLINAQSGKDIQHSNQNISKFLHEHLEEYGDSIDDILAAIEYVFTPHRGGHILLGLENGEIVGAVVLNFTGMKGYIPENILVYIAVHKNHRGKGFGVQLMEQAKKITHGDIALHVEKDNPAKFLYEKVGFTSPYIEMRFKRENKS